MSYLWLLSCVILGLKHPKGLLVAECCSTMSLPVVTGATPPPCPDPLGLCVHSQQAAGWAPGRARD